MTEFSNRSLLEIQESDPPAEICLRGLVLRLDVLYRLPVSLRPLSSLMERTRPLRSLWDPKTDLMEQTRPSNPSPWAMDLFRMALFRLPISLSLFLLSVMEGTRPSRSLPEVKLVLMEWTRLLRSLWEPELVLMEWTRPSESLPRDMGSNQFVLRHLLSAPSKTDGRRAQCRQIEEQS